MGQFIVVFSFQNFFCNRAEKIRIWQFIYTRQILSKGANRWGIPDTGDWRRTHYKVIRDTFEKGEQDLLIHDTGGREQDLLIKDNGGREQDLLIKDNGRREQDLLIKDKGGREQDLLIHATG